MVSTPGNKVVQNLALIVVGGGVVLVLLAFFYFFWISTHHLNKYGNGYEAVAIIYSLN